VNLFVSAAMRHALTSRWGAEGAVFRDRPADAFRPLDPGARPEVRDTFLRRFLGPPKPGDGQDGRAQSSRPVLVVSATSWSADEDFDLLYEALLDFDRAFGGSAPTRASGASLVVVITGRGPLREPFERRIAEAAFRHVAVHTAWLEAEEYPRLLAAADLGLSLHRSASGLDLPMKALDMLGAGVPVAALDYGPVLDELIADERNGLRFRTAGDLAALFASICGEAGATRLETLRTHIRQHPLESWRAAWQEEVLQLLVDKASSPNR
jgi:beta-1,4-mannosyltransferase